MSINRNRMKLNQIFSNREYKLILLNEEYPLYWDEGIYYYPIYGKNNKKRIMSYQVRMYKTWKHNRKKQYKETW